MSATRRLRAFSPLRLTGALVLLLLLFPLLVLGASPSPFAPYLVFVLATIAVVRSVPVEPGMWLRRRPARRALVCALVVVTGSFLVIPGSYGIPLLLGLALLDIVLGMATARLASAPDETVDEWEESLRNRAHRVAYVIFAAVVAGTVVVAEFASPASRTWLSGAVGGGALITLGELMFFLPAFVVAWLEPTRPGEDAPVRQHLRRARIAAAMVVTALLLPVAAMADVAFLPVRTTHSVAPETASAGQHCSHFEAHAQVGYGLGADIPLNAVACWNGNTASEEWGLNGSDCHERRSEFATVATAACTLWTGPDGTLHFTYSATVQPAGLPFLNRDVTVSLVLDRDGRVVQFP